MQERPSEGATRVAEILLGSEAMGPMPDLVELTTAVTSLCTLKHRKRLIPLPDHPIEYALVRRGSFIDVSRYESGGFRDPDLVNRPVVADLLLSACAQASLARAESEPEGTGRQIALRVAERALRARVTADDASAAFHQISGGVEPSEIDGAKLAFRFEARVPVSQAPAARITSHSDAHALLFTGRLEAYVHGKRVLLSDGLIALPIERLVRSVQHLVDARDEGRPIRKRVLSEGFGVEVKCTRPDAITITLASVHTEPVTASELDASEVALPILTLASDFIRALTAADRSQHKNLLVRGLRDEIRELRRRVRHRKRGESFVNEDPDRLRLAPRAPQRRAPERVALGTHVPPRFSERFSISIDGIDTDSVFLTEGALIVGGCDNTVALARDDGRILWAREAKSHRLTLAGDLLLREGPEGAIDVCELEEGETVFELEGQGGDRATHRPIVAGGGAIPRVAILSEGLDRLSALDLRTGERRFRFATRTRKPVYAAARGRMLVLADEEGAVHGLDLATGDVVWRFTADTRFVDTPVLDEDTVVVRSAGGKDARGCFYAIDLFRGNLLHRLPIDGHVRGAPMLAGDRLLVVLRRAGEPLLCAYGLRDGRPLYEIDDPGIASGAGSIVHDDALFVHGAWGELSAIRLQDGATRFRTEISGGEGDELPKSLVPIVHGSVLVLPGNGVSMVRIEDGLPIRVQLPTDLIPDKLLVGENGWIYIAEASGHLAAFAPIPQLSLVRGGR
jgi:outer membrane protein assembly factor BamB